MPPVRVLIVEDEKQIARFLELELRHEGYTVDIEYDGRIDLTKREYDLLEYLMRNRDIVLTREQILENVWGFDYMGDTNVVDVYIRYLRSKIDESYDARLIHTIRGVGYVMREGKSEG